MFKGTHLYVEKSYDLEPAVRSKDLKFVKDCAELAVESRNPFLICDFAEFVPLADTPEIMKLLEDGMIACGDIYHEYEFAFCMADAGKKCFDLKRFEQRFRESGIAKIMYYCMECLVGCDISAMEDSLMDTKDTKYIQLFMENEDIPKQHSKFWYKSAIENFDREHAETSYGKYLPNELNVETVYGGDDAILAYAVDESNRLGNPMLINMAGEYTDCDKRDAFWHMINCMNLLHTYEYYCSAANEGQKDYIFNLILDSGYAKIMYYMIAWTDLPLDKCYKMQQAIELTDNEKYITKTAQAIAEKESALGID